MFFSFSTPCVCHRGPSSCAEATPRPGGSGGWQCGACLAHSHIPWHLRTPAERTPDGPTDIDWGRRFRHSINNELHQDPFCRSPSDRSNGRASFTSCRTMVERDDCPPGHRTPPLSDRQSLLPLRTPRRLRCVRLRRVLLVCRNAELFQDLGDPHLG